MCDASLTGSTASKGKDATLAAYSARSNFFISDKKKARIPLYLNSAAPSKPGLLNQCAIVRKARSCDEGDTERLTRSLPLARPPASPSMSRLPKLAPFLDCARNDKRRSAKCWLDSPADKSTLATMI